MSEKQKGLETIVMRKRTLGVLAIGLFCAVLAQAQQYKSEYKMSVIGDKPISLAVIGGNWADAIREQTKGRINIKVYPNSMLIGGDQTREFSALRQGVIDVALGAGISWSAQVKEFNAFSLPFLISSNEAADAVVAGPAGEMVFKRLRELGVEPLAWGEVAFRIVVNSKHPIRKPEDMKGLKMRVIGSPLFMDFYTTLGANPTQMSMVELQAALASGAVDGAENSIEGFNWLKMVTLRQKYLTRLNHAWEPVVFSINKAVWASWSVEDQEIVRRTAKDYGVKLREMNRKGLTTTDDSMVKQIEASGASVVTLTPEERQAFRKATKEVYGRWAAQLDPELVTAVEKSTASVGR